LSLSSLDEQSAKKKGRALGHCPIDTPHPPLTKEEARDGLASVGCVIRPVVAVRAIVGVRRIGRGVINGGRRRIVGIGRRVVCVGRWIRIAAIPTSSPPNLLDAGI